MVREPIPISDDYYRACNHFGVMITEEDGTRHCTGCDYVQEDN